MAKKTKSPNTSNMLIKSGSQVATAPYNFVPLPYAAIPAPLDQVADWEVMEPDDVQKYYKEYIQTEGKHTGYIDLVITTKKPCFIGGNGEEFFAPVDKDRPIIPGSSIRGMVKQIFKIITCGTMRCDGDVEMDFHNKRLYYRAIAAVKELEEFKNLYHDELEIKVVGKKSYSGAKGGFLVTYGKDYYICPAQYKRVKGTEKKNHIDWDEYEGKCVCYTGPIQSKEEHDVIWDGDWEHPLPVSPKVIQAYREDTQRGNAMGDPDRDNAYDLLREGHYKSGDFAQHFTKGCYDTVVPCYYMADNQGNVKHFGFGPFYRAPYKLDIQAHVPEAVRRPITDFADAVFGKKELWGSRVFFEDALFDGDKPQWEPCNYSHPLMTPKPTSFQLYLEQSKSTASNHWDKPNAVIRGYKLYWHSHKPDPKKSWSWEMSGDEKMIKGKSKITPIKYNQHFKGRIRFCDLSDIELGALASVFGLGDYHDICYKIGQGKSLGLGSIEIKPTLYLTDAQEEGQDLFGDEGWYCGDTETDPAAYIKAFEDYMDAQLAEAQATDKTKHEQTHVKQYARIKKILIKMLSWNKSPKDEAIRTMKIDDPDKPFQKKWVLPTVEQLIPGE